MTLEDELVMLFGRPSNLQETEAERNERENEQLAHLEVLFTKIVGEKTKRDCISWPEEDFTRGYKRGFEIGEYYQIRSVAKNLIKTDLPLEIIITATGLTREEIEGLRNLY